MAIYLLSDEPVFPDPNEADPDGLIAIGGDLSVERLLAAYSAGIFPWFMEKELIFWFSPDPRLILWPEKFKMSGSLERVVHSGKFSIRVDCAFGEVIRNCAAMHRKHETGTWINAEFIRAYQAFHEAGYAHSVETWKNGTLAGGLYGILIGKVFIGESMFHLEPNASKIALHGLVEYARHTKIRFIDCQTVTAHLKKMGAEVISRKKYLQLLRQVTR